jgi:hypothetical protein
MLDVTMGYFGNIIQCIFELARSVALFPIVLVQQNSQGEYGKYNKEVDKYSAAKGALYNHVLCNLNINFRSCIRIRNGL